MVLSESEALGLNSQKVVSISPVRDALQRDIDKDKEFIFENKKKRIKICLHKFHRCVSD